VAAVRIESRTEKRTKAHSVGAVPSGVTVRAMRVMRWNLDRAMPD
jgi:hypothetical protein